MTFAPRSESSIVQNGPESMWLTSRTVIPASGLALQLAPAEVSLDIGGLTACSEIILYGGALAL